MSRLTSLPGTTPVVEHSAYARLNQQDGNAAYYDGVMYSPSSYEAHIWSIQRPIVERLAQGLAQAGPLRVLDFACGTGRILQVVEPYAAHACGLDTSREMLDAAAQKCTRAELIHGDLLANQASFSEAFDLITAFRFFLNTEQEMRLPVMTALGGLLRGQQSRLVFNIHGHRPSALLFTSAYRRLRGWPPVTTMSTREIRTLVAAADLEIVAWYGQGLLPPRLFRSRLGNAAKWIDTKLSTIPATRWISRDVVVVCRRAGAAGHQTAVSVRSAD